MSLVQYVFFFFVFKQYMLYDKLKFIVSQRNIDGGNATLRSVSSLEYIY